MISEKQTHNVSLFAADFEQEASSDHTFLRTRLVEQQLLMVLNSSFCRNWIILMWPIRGFNKTVPRAVQPMKRFNYWRDETFASRVLSRFGDQNWLPRSCDLTPLDFFLWGYLKWKLYVNNPNHSATIMQKGNEKFRRKGAYMAAKPWKPFARYVIP